VSRPAKLAVAVLALTACRDDPPAPDLLDTGWFTADDEPGCPHRFVDAVPSDGTADWFYLDVPRVFTDTTDPSGYEAWLATVDGREVPTTVVWSEADSAFDLVPDAPLPPDTDFEIVVQDCVGTASVEFSTSDFGLPLVDSVRIAGRTYRLDLGGATWQKPEGLGPIIAAFLSEPILLGVTYADDERIDLLGAPSTVDGVGNVSQAEAPTWDFPLSPFDPIEPTFAIRAEQIELLVQEEGNEAPIPVTGFELSGTLSSDGTRLGGGTLAGTADSRFFAAEFLANEDAICDLAESSFQVSCDRCPSDGEPFCLDLAATGVVGSQQVGLTLVSRAP